MIKVRLLVLIFIFCVIIFGALFLLPQRMANVDVEHAPIATTIYPLYEIAQNVAGDDLDVSYILPPGASPHTFEPSPSTLRALNETIVVYAIGYGFDNWVDDLIESGKAEKIIVDRDIEIREVADDDHHNGEDPHYWLTINNAKKIAQTIADDLINRYPDLANQIKANLDDYITRLDAADDQIRLTLDPVENTSLITLHDAWYYFAQEYDLNIAGTFEPSAGREPTPQYLLELTTTIESTGVTALYSEPQLSTTTIDAFLKDNNLIVAELDPLGGVSERETYIDLMLYNAQVIAKNQK
ncbi:MAG: metal ABC transporter substrate-binding protein [Patescibacteria group bacterium]